MDPQGAKVIGGEENKGLFLTVEWNENETTKFKVVKIKIEKK
jgi:hypothetical protein